LSPGIDVKIFQFAADIMDRMITRQGQNKLDQRRLLGSHLTPVSVFQDYVLPDLKPLMHDHMFMDLFCGEGNLILPMLDLVPRSERTNYFRQTWCPACPVSHMAQGIYACPVYMFEVGKS